MIRKSTATLLAAATTTALVAGSANAAVIVNDSQASKVNGFVGSYTLFGSYNVGSSDKLVVIAHLERDRGDANTAINSVTYNGIAMNEVIQDKGWGEGPVAIFYLDDPSTIAAAGDIVVNGSAKMNGTLGTVLALSGTADGDAAIATSTDGSTTNIVSPGAGILVAAYQGNNGGTPTADSPLTGVLSNNGGSNYFQGASGYQLVTAGSYDPSFTGTGATPVTVAAVFSEVPEPSSLALLGLGGLLIARRRRG